MAVEPILLQQRIEENLLHECDATDKIFLSPLAEKQWREDFSGVACVSKLFALFLSKNIDNKIYVSSFVFNDDRVDFKEDPLFIEKWRDGNCINYCGASSNAILSTYPPANIAKIDGGYNTSVYDTETSNAYCVIFDTYGIDQLVPSIVGSIQRTTQFENVVAPKNVDEEFSKNFIDGAVAMRQDRLDNQEIVVAETKKKLKQNEASLESMQTQFEKFFVNNAAENLETQLKAIEKFPSIKSIQYIGNQLIVYTNMIDIGVTDKDWQDGVWADVTMPLGEFEIKIDLKQIIGDRWQSDYMRFVNITRFKSGENLIHPHIPDPSGTCFDQWGENFVQAAENFSIIGLVSNAVNFLRTFNPEDSWGANIHKFSGAQVFAGVTEGDEGRIEYENGDYERPGSRGEWSFYEGDGEWRGDQWEWYEENANGTWRFGGWEWFDELDGYQGTYDSFLRTFTWYEDDVDYVNVDGEWINADEDPDYVWYNDEWVYAVDNPEFLMENGEWTHISEIESEQEEVVA